MQITFEVQEKFSVDLEKRTITGLAVPYGVESSIKNGRRFRFSKGFAKFKELSRIKILRDHDNSQAVGRVIALDDQEDGLWATFWIKRGRDGDAVLYEAANQVRDGLSIGMFDPVEFSEDSNGVLDVSSAFLREITITAMPSFDDARIKLVNFSLDNTDEDIEMTEIEDKKTEAPAAPVAIDFSGLTAAISEGFSAAFEKFNEKPEVISHEPLFVAESAPYRFDRGGNLTSTGQFNFSADLGAALKHPNCMYDAAAEKRVLSFMAQQFDIDTTDAAGLNPNKNRPDLYVDQRDYLYPIWDAFKKETIKDRTPLVLPKYSSSSGLVATHTEGTEPAVGAMVWTTQTITPQAVSGKVELTRETWDQIGQPSISGLLWRQFTKGWFEALEARAVAALTAAAGSITDIALTAGGGTDGQTAVDELITAFSNLQVTRGGFGFDVMATQIDLYTRLATAKDGDKRYLLPQHGPTNAVGTSARKYASLDIAGVETYPSWALAASGQTTVQNSWLFESASVYGAASAPERLDWNFGATVQTANIPQLAYVTVGIWGYAVAAILDTTGVRQVTYDPVA